MPTIISTPQAEGPQEVGVALDRIAEVERQLTVLGEVAREHERDERVVGDEVVLLRVPDQDRAARARGAKRATSAHGPAHRGPGGGGESAKRHGRSLPFRAAGDASHDLARISRPTTLGRRAASG
jgi:hypothetical protein